MYNYIRIFYSNGQWLGIGSGGGYHNSFLSLIISEND